MNCITINFDTKYSVFNIKWLLDNAYGCARCFFNQSLFEYSFIVNF